MPLYTYNGNLLVRDGALATDQGCCCDSPCDCESDFGSITVDVCGVTLTIAPGDAAQFSPPDGFGTGILFNVPHAASDSAKCCCQLIGEADENGLFRASGMSVFAAVVCSDLYLWFDPELNAHQQTNLGANRWMVVVTVWQWCGYAPNCEFDNLVAAGGSYKCINSRDYLLLFDECDGEGAPSGNATVQRTVITGDTAVGGFPCECDEEPVPEDPETGCGGCDKSCWAAYQDPAVAANPLP